MGQTRHCVFAAAVIAVFLSASVAARTGPNSAGTTHRTIQNGEDGFGLRRCRGGRAWALCWRFKKAEY